MFASKNLKWIIVGLIGLVIIGALLNQDQGSFLGLNGDRLASFIIMSIWGAIIGAAIIPRSGSLANAAKQAAAWIVIILVLMFGYIFRFDLQDMGSRLTAGIIPGSPMSTSSLEGRNQVMLIKPDGRHFQAKAMVNGAEVNFLVDTGASTIVLSNEDAKLAGIDVENLVFNITVSTANGQARTAKTKLADFKIGNIDRSQIEAMVAQPDSLDVSLLGMNFLEGLWSFEIRGDRMILTD